MRRTSVPLRLAATLAALALGLGLGAAAPAAAQGAQGAQGVTLAPARVELDLPTPDVAVEFAVSNAEATPQAIIVTVAGLGHNLEGTPNYLDGTDVGDVLALSPASFVLAPGGRQTVTLRGRIPSGVQGVYGAVLAEFADATGTPDGSVSLRTRLAGLLLLRAPRPWTEAVEITGTGAVQTPPGTSEPYQLFIEAHNTGLVHLRPTGRVEVLDAAGQRLAVVEIAPENVLPGYARRLAGLWRPPAGYTGELRLRATLDGPNGPVVDELGSLTLVDGRVPAAGPPMAVSPVAPDRGAAIGSFLLATASRRGWLVLASVLLALAVALGALRLRQWQVARRTPRGLRGAGARGRTAEVGAQRG
jgi:hypothetical protein